jgi:asparagine synthase (glutamine-hydrolysing)
MIGGYIYRGRNLEVEERLEEKLGTSHTRTPVWDRGFLFFDDPFRDDRTSRLVSEDLIALSQDVLVRSEPDAGHRTFDLRAELPSLFARGPAEAFDGITSDYRMACVHRDDDQITLYLVSNRAGSGRVYYHPLNGGIVFSSDLRFLLSVVGCDLNPLGVYSILKYGAIPEPMTISANVRAVPAAHYLRYDVETESQVTAPYFRLRFACDHEVADDRDEDAALVPSKEALQSSAGLVGTLDPVMLLSGGIDSSLYGAYLRDACGRPLRAFYCVFGDDDPELDYARQVADRLDSDLAVVRMEQEDALSVLDDVARLTDHPFSDFSSMPTTFLVRSIVERVGEGTVIVECNGGDDCFGFPDLGNETKSRLKHRFPPALKRLVAAALRNRGYWKWESHEGLLARASALADVHEASALDYFLVLTPVQFLGFDAPREWDDALHGLLAKGFHDTAADGGGLSFGARTTVRQLLQVNSRRWAAKALSVGDTLGAQVIYPYIWRDVLIAQGEIPWHLKIRDGVVKWPLKRLLEEYMPGPFIYRKKSGFVPPFARWLAGSEFNDRAREVLLDRDARVTEVVPSATIDSLLRDARVGRRLRHSVLNFLWGALFTEMWLHRHTGVRG